MQKKTKQNLYKFVEKAYKKLIFGSSADAVKLIVAGDSLTSKEIDQMEWFHVSEIKSVKGGGFEIKFFDRLKAVDGLYKMIEEQHNSQEDSSFFDAIKDASVQLESCGYE
ncbi:MAG: hypothetical protein RSB96_00370 [Oscillospiraceae bacterium]